MADSKVSGLSAMTDLLGVDLFYVVDNATADKSLYAGDLNLLPNGFVVNGKISVTVSSNNLTVALKTLNDADPSSTNPVGVWINGTYRRCTAALSVTKNAGTNWFASGSSELATKEIDYFVYLLWNTTPGTDIMDIGFSRIPYGRVYSDFSSTTTNEKYLAFANASTPTSTDDCVVIGRFAATLSAGAGYTWTVPTFTNTNLIRRPIYETRLLDYVPTITGYSSNPATTTYKYKFVNDFCFWYLREGANGTSNATTKTYTLPLAASLATYLSIPTPVDGGSQVASGLAALSSSTATMYTSALGSWTSSGNCRMLGVSGWYPI